MSEVHVALYDLSRGMAASLSAQFLGPNHIIDIVPHTGILVFGKEYFFGGGGHGIGADDPTYFRSSRGMQPIKIIPLGRTTTTKEQFDVWCRAQMESGRYHGNAYDLLHNNCNNFSHDAAKEGLNLPQGVPQWILDVPSRFLASPMGQIIRPMLENMQMTGGGGIPFLPTPVAASRQQEVVGSYNPWTDYSSNRSIATPILDTNNRPLLSNDKKTATLCATKLIAASQIDADKAALEDLHIALSQASVKPSTDVIERGSIAIHDHLIQNPGNLTFSLMLLRLVVLHPPTIWSTKCVKWIHDQLKLEGISAISSTTSKSMAWCAVSNAYGTYPDDDIALEEICVAALGDISKSKPVEVRQSASAFLYNVALIQSPLMKDEEELSDLLVSLLCGTLEGLDTEEPDKTTKLRRLLCAARLVKSDAGLNNTAKQLVVASELDDIVRALVKSGDDQVAPLAAELLAILES